jgi:hypothetical protein
MQFKIGEKVKLINFRMSPKSRKTIIGHDLELFAEIESVRPGNEWDYRVRLLYTDDPNEYVKTMQKDLREIVTIYSMMCKRIGKEACNEI